MSLPLYTVDAFTNKNKRFTGNPAAICILEYDDDIIDELKQKIASEINLSETAFVAKQWTQHSKRANESSFTLRWFTPTIEVPLCGHATLATAVVLFERIKQSATCVDDESNKITFDTKFKGQLEVEIDWKTNLISLNFPSDPPKPFDKSSYPWIENFLSAVLGPQLHINCVEDIQYGESTKKLLLRLTESLENNKTIRSVCPDFDKLLNIDTNNLVKGVIVTQKATDSDELHFLSRYFGPWSGINEDPVTGAAHTVLVPYWKSIYERNAVPIETLVGYQCSARGGIVYSRVAEHRVIMSGNAIIVFEGQLRL